MYILVYTPYVNHANTETRLNVILAKKNIFGIFFLFFRMFINMVIGSCPVDSQFEKQLNIPIQCFHE